MHWIIKSQSHVDGTANRLNLLLEKITCYLNCAQNDDAPRNDCHVIWGALLEKQKPEKVHF
jgi:hypothetical protein